MSEIPRFWRNQQTRYSLVGEVCPNCETKMFPPRDVCIGCGNEVKATKEEILQAIRSSFSSPRATSTSSR